MKTVELLWSDDRGSEVAIDDIDAIARIVSRALCDGSGDRSIPCNLDERVCAALEGAWGASPGQVRMVLEAVGRPRTING